MKQKFAYPSREDAWVMTRAEKASMMFLMNAVSTLTDVQNDLKDRIEKTDGGAELIESLVRNSMKLLTEVRMTVPEEQRRNMANTAMDYEMRLVPRLTPSKANVVVDKENFRKLVDAAQTKCVSCVEDYETCKRCGLYQLLTVLVPLDRYDGTYLCPYNMAEWGN